MTSVSSTAADGDSLSNSNNSNIAPMTVQHGSNGDDGGQHVHELIQSSLRRILQLSLDNRSDLSSGADGNHEKPATMVERSSRPVASPLITCLVQLRHVARQIHQNTLKLKSDSSTARDRLNQLHQQLECHQYQRRHVQMRIDQLRDYPAIYDKLELCDEEAYKQWLRSSGATNDTTGGTTTNAISESEDGELDRTNDPHQYMLGRLEFERKERTR